ncbi:MAG: pyridoxal phosphate-dependent aminotransferase [Planctomycetes bacterium]|nr:pyridoxal phosphate-dependent aminotransferase [Planctomycetota bacterium]
MGHIQPSKRSEAITESITLAISARAAAMKAAGEDVISLGAGEPDFPTYEPVARAGIDAITGGITRYTASSGLPDVRAAAARWFRQFDLPYETQNVMVTAGAKPALTMALLALADPDDCILTPAPYWPSYPEMVKLVGARSVDIALNPAEGFVPTREEIVTAAREHGAKGIMINFPNNPSGAVPTRDQVESIVDAAIEADLWILSDEIYAKLIYEGEHVSPASFDKGFDRTVVVNGGTKSHSMTGWRVGFLAGPADIVAAAGRLQSQAIGNACSISQMAAKRVCEGGDDDEMSRRLRAFDERRQYLLGAINEIPGLALDRPQGAFYALVDARGACERLGIDDLELTERLLVESKVAVVPGSAFAIPGFLRLSYAASMDDLERAVARMQSFFGAS